MQQRLVEQFVHFLRTEGVTESTVRIYASSVSMYLDALAISASDPSTATREMIARYFQWLRSRGYAPGTLASHQTGIRRFHDWLTRQGLVALNPIAKRIPIRLGRKLPRHISQDAAERLIESVAGKDPLSIRDRAMLELLYGCGLRAAELVGLRLRHVDQRAGTIRIRGKGGIEAVIGYGEKAAVALNAYVGHARAELLERQAHDMLWVNCFGGPLRYCGLHRMVRERGEAAEIPRLRPHMLRHSFGTHLLERGANLRVIQELMRHASIRSTEIYTHIDPTRLAEERRRFHPRG